ncbi:protein bfr2-like [Lathyrus oleraceus]|uniref:protein bfr2-like n=1 Tax=Pisum sativum TaxID=3888 RepID=UPI0021D1C290|nr:protein bfr2-like [Pisum sativum]
MNPSPPLTISGVVQNKGSSTGAQNLEADNAQNEQETSSPGEDGKEDSKHVDEKDSTEKEDSEDTPSNSPARVTFPSDDVDEDDQDSDEVEGYFQEDEEINVGEADPEGNQTGTGDANVDTVPNPIKVRPSITQTSPISLTEVEKKDLKQNDPLKYVSLMMAQRESSSEQSISGASTHSGASANEASHDEILQQVKKAVFDVDLFEELRNNVGASFGIKKLISKINITACPTNIGEALIDIQNLIDQVCVEYHREVDAKSKLLSTEKAQATEFDNALRTSQASEELAASRKSAQVEFDTYTASIRLWESHITELQKKISDAKAKQAAIQGLDNTEADDLAKQSVDHVEKATAMNGDIARLRGVQAAVQYKIGLAKKKYDRMRAIIPF